MNTPPLPSQTRRSPLWIIAIAAVILVSIRLAYFGWQEIQREDTPQRYTRLCALLLSDLPADTAQPIKLTEAETILSFQNRYQELSQLSRECRQLASAAKDTCKQMENLQGLSKRVPSPANLLFATIETSVGLGVKSGGMIESGSKGMIQEGKTYVQFYGELNKIRQQLQVDRLQLVHSAPQYSGPMASAPAFACSFTEENPSTWNRVFGDGHSLNKTQSLQLTNTSDRDLTHCIISVRLVEPSGESYQHFYYVESWTKGVSRSVKYEPLDVYSDTSTDITRVQVELWASELSSPVVELTRKGETWPYTPGQ